jgi:hypothetical protein
MNDYRLFLKDARGRMVQRVELECPDDQTAIAHVRTLPTPYRKDLWVDSRRVCEFPPAIGPVVAACLDRWKHNHIAP